ncbi:MAG TPA: SAM-dependent chlorinase/fluorinase [Chitinophagaceae bacterium]|nr:SAM-dependent chlorinase/fluorinase [Chitinophagaceae bacterium]
MAVITLTSDIGLKDYIIGAIKGQLHQLCPGSLVVDISHQVPPFNFPQAVYQCKSAFSYFPSETCHFILINLFDRKSHHFLLARQNEQYYFCADNGLISMILDGVPQQVVQLDAEKGVKRNIIQVTQLFATAAYRLRQGADMNTLGTPPENMLIRTNILPSLSKDWMEGQIIYIDQFENVVVNITRDQFEEQRKGRGFRIYVMRDEYISKISESYFDEPEGDKLALFNAAGYLEIAINKGNAAGLFGLHQMGREETKKESFFQTRLLYQTIRIEFELD